MSFLSAIGRFAIETVYELSPILLKNGIASEREEKLMLIGELTQSLPPLPLTENNGFFAHWKTIGGGSLMQNSVAQYPLANQATAGNAIVQQPVNISMLMYCPATSLYNFALRRTFISGILSSLDLHVRLGGLFVVYTPFFTYDNCVLTGIRDASEGSVTELQNAMIFDFMRPMIMDEQEAQTAQNAFMSKITDGEKI